MRKEKIQELAVDYRKKFTSDRYGIADIFDSCEKNNFEVFRYPLEFDNILGFAELRGDSRIIFSNSSAILARENFTVAHEIGHHLLGHLDENNMIKDNDQNLRSFVSGEEHDANIFATNFLVPEDNLLNYIEKELNNKESEKIECLDVAKMQVYFSVSFEMLLIRLNEINYINTLQKQQLSTEKMKIASANLLKMICGSSELCEPTLAKRIPYKYVNCVIENYKMKLIPEETLRKALSYFSNDVDSIVESFSLNENTQEKSLDELLGGA